MPNLIIEYVDGYAGRIPYYMLRRAPDQTDETGHHMMQTYARLSDGIYVLFELNLEPGGPLIVRGDRLFGNAHTPDQADFRIHQRLVDIVTNLMDGYVEYEGATLDDRTKHAPQQKTPILQS